MSDDSEDYVRMNKRHWDVWARRDWPHKADGRRQIRDGEPYLERIEPKLAPYLRDIAGKKIIVLQFGDGLVLLACAKKGAEVTGVDLSAEQNRLVREAAAFCGVEVNLVEGDCQNLPASITNDYFDLAVAECGVFCWIQSPEAWMNNAYRVLKSGGRLAVTDFHPISTITEEKDGKITLTRSYFDQQPKIVVAEADMPPTVEFLWKLSDVINAAIHAGFQIEHMDEFSYEHKSETPAFLPTDFLLVAKKP